jgi:methyltransferase FkbM-like protein
MNLYPRLIKMDIEGAEFDALMGSVEILARCHPHLILEQQPHDPRGVAMLRKLGYVLFDLATYEVIEDISTLNASVVNALAIHGDQVIQTNWAPPLRLQDLQVDDPVGPGRFVVRVRFDNVSKEDHIFAGLRADGEVILRYETNSAFLADSYSSWPVQLARPQTILPFIEGRTSARISGYRVQEVVNFRGASSPIV